MDNTSIWVCSCPKKKRCILEIEKEQKDNSQYPQGSFLLGKSFMRICLCGNGNIYTGLILSSEILHTLCADIGSHIAKGVYSAITFTLSN